MAQTRHSVNGRGLSLCASHPKERLTDPCPSIRLTEAQKKLMDLTLTLPRYAMLGAPEVLQLNANLIRAIGGRKVSAGRGEAVLGGGGRVQ